MVTTIRPKSQPHLYITEWMEKFGLNDAKLSGRLEVAPNTVWRWRIEQHRLNPEKIAAIAHAIDDDLAPEDMFRPPERPSLDAYLRGKSPEEIERAFRLVRALSDEAA